MSGIMEDLSPSFHDHDDDLSFNDDGPSPSGGVPSGISPLSASAVDLADDGLSDLLHGNNLEELMPMDTRVMMMPSSVPRKAAAQKSAKVKPTPSGPGGGRMPKKRFQCTVASCQYSTPYAKDLARHMRKHTGEKPYQCQKCAKSFSRYDKLKVHALTHDGIRPYKCTFCNYAASDSGSLRKHVRIHTNERPHKCQLCSYQARDASQLVIHLRHHTGDTPYVCTHEGCKAAFKTPSDLQRHNRLHTGEKPYQCPHCPHKAAVKCNLSVHIKKVHLYPKKPSVTTEALVTDFVAPPFQLPPEVSGSQYPTSSQHLPATTITDDSTHKGCDGGFNDTLPKGDYVPNLVTTTPKTDPPVKAPRRKTPRTKTDKLPFQYACKYCPVKCDTMKAFKTHVLQTHKDINLGSVAKSLQEEAKSVIVSPASAKTKVIKTDVAKLFECHLCPAAFAVEESLKCHLKQHSPKTPPSLCLPPHVDLSGRSYAGPSHGRHDNIGGIHSIHHPSDLIVRSETTVIAGQTQQVYVIVRNNNVPDKPPNIHDN